MYVPRKGASENSIWQLMQGAIFSVFMNVGGGGCEKMQFRGAFKNL